MFVMAEEKQLSWMEQKYLQHQLEVGRQSLDSFAEYLGVSQSFLSKVMAGKANPSPEAVYQWYKKLGDASIFPAFEIPPEKRDLLELQDAINQIPPDNRKEILRVIDDWMIGHNHPRIP